MAEFEEQMEELVYVPPSLPPPLSSPFGEKIEGRCAARD